MAKNPALIKKLNIGIPEFSKRLYWFTEGKEKKI